jgi:predicted glycogen debranching enzyme
VDDGQSEWLEADGRGGFASGGANGIRTRRYHALLLWATTPPTGRIVLVNGCDAWLDVGDRSWALTTQAYTPDMLHPEGASRIVGFDYLPWPTWELALPDDIRVRHEIIVEHGTGVVLVSWQLVSAPAEAVLRVRPFFSGRDYHALHRRNDGFRFEPGRSGARTTFAPYPGIPSVTVESTGAYHHQPQWYLNFFYRLEQERGLDSVEDLATLGEWHFTLSPSASARLLLSAGPVASDPPSAADVERRSVALVASERSRRQALGDPLRRAADAYIVSRGHGKTIMAGYPWFTDWGRDTFISLRGLCLAGGRAADARDMLIEWAGAVSEGMLPNRFPDSGEQPDYNSVDASLWFIVAVFELLQRSDAGAVTVSTEQRNHLIRAVSNIVSGYAAGTRYGIRMDADGLLACGVPGSQLTWMDGRVGDRAITPRVGKPVEIQALWLNALSAATSLGLPWSDWLGRGRQSFPERFWNASTHMLADVVDVDHVPGTRDDTCRPNQILAVGGLPLPLLDADRARQLVDAVEQRLLTPLGLRTLPRDDPRYASTYAGGPSERDAVYHQGTVWPWLLGPFVEAWLRVRGSTKEARAEARQRFLEPLRAHLESAGLGHVSEIADGDAPHTPRGCPFQAWSLGEVMRIEALVGTR